MRGRHWTPNHSAPGSEFSRVNESTDRRLRRPPVERAMAAMEERQEEVYDRLSQGLAARFKIKSFFAEIGFGTAKKGFRQVRGMMKAREPCARDLLRDFSLRFLS